MSKVLEFVIQGGDEEEKYRHRDTLRHIAPPEGLTPEEWWYAIKLKRLGNRKAIPLVDSDKKPFSFALTDTILTSLHKIDLHMGGGISLPEPITNPQTRNEFLVRSLIEEAITSSQLEGASTTRLVAKEMLKSNRAPRNKNEKMIYNNHLAMERIRDIRDVDITVEAILELHNIVTDSTLEDSSAAGRFRRSDERVVMEDKTTGEVLHNPPPANELNARIAALCDFANGKNSQMFVHPVLRAIVVHFWLSYDHAFVDGNGRTARALFYWSMLHSKYWLFEFISISEFLLKAPVKYARSFLYTETDDNDLNYFILYQLEIVNRALDSLYEHIKNKTEESRVFESKLKHAHFFNHRQERLLMHALKHPGTGYTVQEHKNSFRIAYDTARNDLLDLEKKGFFQHEKRGNAYMFFASRNLFQLISD
ncbi:MAG: Fic family protein [Waddliaceae bacterium]